MFQKYEKLERPLIFWYDSNIMNFIKIIHRIHIFRIYIVRKQGVIVLHEKVPSDLPSPVAAAKDSAVVDSIKKYRIRGGFVLRRIGGEYTIIPLDETSEIKNAVMVPNDTAAYLWNLFGQPCTLEQAVQHILEEFDGPPEKIRQDVEMFVMESLQMQILEEVI